MKYRTIETQVPWKFKWKATDDDGNKHVYTKKPKEGKYWVLVLFVLLDLFVIIFGIYSFF